VSVVVIYNDLLASFEQCWGGGVQRRPALILGDPELVSQSLALMWCVCAGSKFSLTGDSH
jgi:hypothetical protein